MRPIRLNSNDLPQGTVFDLHLGANAWNGGIHITNSGKFINIDNILSVWYRKPGDYNLPNDLTLQEREFAREEIRHTVDGLLWSLDTYWMSHPSNLRQANRKLEQLHRAKKFGFTVPKTLVSTSPERVQNFFQECRGKMIYKVLSSPFLASDVAELYNQVPERLHVKTTLITDVEIAMLESIKMAPCLFQEYIDKTIELRVTIIGEDVFAAEIHSQSNSKTSIDWRDYSVDIPYRKANLPVEVSDRCLAFVKSYGLNYSALDIILTPQGEYVFLENNPNGQFMWIERLVPELAMTSALTSCLARGSNI